MRLFSLIRRQRLAVSLQDAWLFFSDPRNLPAITPPGLRLEITSELPDRIHPGLIIVYRVRPLFGIPATWVSEITHVVEPHLFVDEQRFGPYRFWHHQHSFRQIDHGTEVSDTVHYGVLIEPFGSLVDRLVVRNQLKSIFEYRRRYLHNLFGAARNYGTNTQRTD